MSVNEGRKRVSFGFACFQVVLAYEVIVLCKCSGKYIDIYSKLKITFLSQRVVFLDITYQQF